MSDEEADIPDSDHPGDYSTRMEELFDDEDELGSNTDDEAFVYTGVDADTPAGSGYHDQLRDILGPEAGDDNMSIAVQHVLDEEINAPAANHVHPPRPILHPSVSRLRSYIPGSASHTPSDTSFASVPTPQGPLSSSPLLPSGTPLDDDRPHTAAKEREVFKWAELGSISHYFYAPQSRKSNAILGTVSTPRPTVLTSNGMICVGTEYGSVHVFDFKQTLKCVCGADINAKEQNVGRVTALALSLDHTFVASGHSTGHIFLYNLREPTQPARSILPIALSVVASGRKEGHLRGSKIVSVGFIGGRHTAIVSADEHGLAFYHNLSKVLFVEAFDTLRILGRYPLEGSSVNGHSSPTTLKRRKPQFTVLALSPLPLGTSPHVTDDYQLIAMLTPTKVVVVGLRPSPRTWFKCPRGVDEGVTTTGSSKKRGTLAWFPSTSPSDDPTLVYSWGNSIHVIKVKERKGKQLIQTRQKGKAKEVEIGMVFYVDVCRWTTQDDILSIQWLNPNQIIALTSTTLEVYDVHKGSFVEHVSFDATALVDPLWSSVSTGDPNTSSALGTVAHSVRVYKGKVFLLCRDKILVGTLMTWADQILSCVQVGDFLNAIELSRSYYLDEAPGNRNGLPIDPKERRDVIAERMRGLMVASAQYAFSEERLTDDTHVTPDHRGVDRTSLFETLVTVSCRACIALDDFDFLYEGLFQSYDEAGIARIYLLYIQPFILDNSIRSVPPRITQRLIALHEEDGRPDQIERIIWHIDPACLDINQVIRLCQKYQLYDALVYVYTCALRDFVIPIVEFLGIIRQKLRADRTQDAQDLASQELYQYGYKVYPYLETILTGRIYPSNEPLEEADSFQAKKDVFDFLFSGCTRLWPEKGGQLVLTSLEDGGEEPSYPYVRQLLAFGSEWFLHSLDEAFEESIPDEELRTKCQSIIRILLEILASNSLPTLDGTFIRIFVARTVPKYPKIIYVPANTLYSILVGLAEDRDLETQEDRQLAAESLLSIYHPENWDNILRLFTEAGFYRILRQRYLHDNQWSALLTTYLDDTSLETSDIVSGINKTFTTAQKSNLGVLPSELMVMLESRLSAILDVDVGNAALLVDEYQPNLHDSALHLLENDFRRFQYLGKLLEPNTSSIGPLPASRTVSRHLCHMYLSLQCHFEPKQVIDVLKSLPPEMLEWDQALRTCESSGVYEAVVWALNWKHDPQGAIAKVETYLKQLTLKALDPNTNENIYDVLNATESITRMGITVCLEPSPGKVGMSSPPEDLWLQLFKTQIYCIQSASGITVVVPPTENHQALLLSSLRSLVQETFDFLVSATNKTVSFPRLFKRLVESVSSSNGAHYTEFRSILTGMLESYRSDGDMLVITKHLVDRDMFDTIATYTRERGKGWAPSTIACSYCRKPVSEDPQLTNGNISDVAEYQVIVSRTGVLSHAYCSPQQS
ncbi:Golgi CORVET complex core vacuolar protein 8 domain containing protein [Amanita muscaria]